MPKFNWKKASREQLELLAEETSKEYSQAGEDFEPLYKDILLEIRRACSLRTREEINADIVETVKMGLFDRLALSMLRDEVAADDEVVDDAKK